MANFFSLRTAFMRSILIAIAIILFYSVLALTFLIFVYTIWMCLSTFSVLAFAMFQDFVFITSDHVKCVCKCVLIDFFILISFFYSNEWIFFYINRLYMWVSVRCVCCVFWFEPVIICFAILRLVYLCVICYGLITI